jgi:hypothetical protein
MANPSSKGELIRAMVSARGQFDALVNQIPRSKMALSGASGEWSVKDIVAHVTSYDRWLGLALALRGQKPPDHWVQDTPLAEFNRKLFDENRDLPLDQVLEDSRRVWAEILEAARAQSETYLFTEQSVPGVPYRFKPSEVLKSESYGHYLDHVPGLKAWIEAMK